MTVPDRRWEGWLGDGQLPAILAALWVSVGISVLAAVAAVVLAFTSGGTANPSLPFPPPKTSGTSGAVAMVPVGRAVERAAPVTQVDPGPGPYQCPSLAGALVAGTTDVDTAGCDSAETGCLLALVVDLAAGIGPFGLSMM